MQRMVEIGRNIQ